MALLSSSVAVAIAADPVASSDQQLWYPDFESDYESGSCTTSPSPALLAFSSGSSSSEISPLAQTSMKSCCATWFPEQERCGCLGGCVDENDAAALTATKSLAEELDYWYPKFDITYEEGQCVKAGVNTDDVPPNYYTEEGGFLHMTMTACCAQWFEQQDGNRCLSGMDELASVSQPTPMVDGTNLTRMSDAILDRLGSSFYFDATPVTLSSY